MTHAPENLSRLGGRSTRPRASLGRAIRTAMLAAVLVGGAAAFMASQIPPAYHGQARVALMSDAQVSAYAASQGLSGGGVARDALIDKALTARVQAALTPDRVQVLATELDFASDTGPGAPTGLAAVAARMALALGHGSPAARSSGDQPAAALLANLTVQRLGQAEVVAVTAWSADPERAALIANRVAEHLVQSQMGGDEGQPVFARSEPLQRLEARAIAAEAALAAARSAVAQTNPASQAASDATAQLTQVAADRSEAEARAKAVREAVDQGGDLDSVADLVKSVLFQQLLADRVAVDRALSERAAMLLPSHPDMRRLTDQRRRLSADLKAEALKAADGYDTQARIAAAKDQAVRASLANVRGTTEDTVKRQEAVVAAEAELADARKSLEAYLAGQRGVAAPLIAQAPTAMILARAFAASQPSYPKPMLVGGLAALAIIGLCLILAALRAVMGGHRAGPRPAKAEAAAEPVRAPSATTAARSLGLTVDDIAMDVLTLIDHEPGVRVLVVGQHEGIDPYQSALALARELAAQGRQVLALGCEAGVVRASGFAEPGFWDLISGLADFETVIGMDHQSRAQIMASGAYPGDTAAADEAGTIAAAFHALDQAYDATVIYGDAAGAEALLAALHGTLDQGVIVADAGRPTEALTFLGRRDVDFPVLVLGGAEPRAMGRSRAPRSRRLMAAE